MKRLAVLRVICGVAALGCGAEEEEGDSALAFDTRPLCDLATMSGSCINAGTETLNVNGLRVIYKRTPGNPLLSFRILFDATPRSALQLWSETIAFSLLEMSGPQTLEIPEWDAQLRELGATLSANTSSDYASIGGLVPVPNWRKLWTLVGTALSVPEEDPYEFEYLRDYFGQSYASRRDDPDQAAHTECWSLLFGGQAYGQYEDTLSELPGVGATNLKPAWRALLAKQRMLVAVVGDVEQAEVVAAVQSTLGGLPDANTLPGFPPLVSQPAAVTANISLLSYPGSPTWHIVSQFKGPQANAVDYAALQLGLRVLGRRLFYEVRDDNGLAYTTGAQLSFYRQSYGTLWITSVNPQQALGLARGIVSELKAAGPDEVELQAARAALRTEILGSAGTPAGLAWLLSDWELTYGAREGVDELLAKADGVTASDVVAALTTYLQNARTVAAGAGAPLTQTDLANLYAAP